MVKRPNFDTHWICIRCDILIIDLLYLWTEFPNEIVSHSIYIKSFQIIVDFVIYNDYERKILI